MEEYLNLSNPLNEQGLFVADEDRGISPVNEYVNNLPSMGQYIQELRNQFSNIKYSNPQQLDYSSDMNLSFPELLKQEGIDITVTSSYRPNAKTKSGHNSHHSYMTEYGSGAVDIVPTDGDFEKLKKRIYSNQRIVSWLVNHNIGILEETTPEVMNKTGATGKHFHVGPDQWAIQMSSRYITYNGNNQQTTINPSKKNAGKDGKERMRYVTNYLMQKHGLDRTHAAALTGVWYAESRLIPSIKSKIDSGTGIAQWTGPRHKEFDRFYRQVFGRQSPGIRNVGLDDQIDVAIAEYKARSNNWRDFLNRNNLQGAVDSVLRGYENGGGSLATIASIDRIYTKNGSGSYRKLMADRLAFAQQAMK